jgi:MoaA/NifB/PqqE/SkfB family radical SAM enzyme
MSAHGQGSLGMLFDPDWMKFTAEIDRVLRRDPTYASRKRYQILAGAARGERIVPFDGRYVVSSFLPPMPSRAFASFLKASLGKDSLYSDLARGRRSAPLSTHLCITSRCQYRCEFCGATTPDRKRELTKEQWIRLIHDLQELGVAYFAFSGGEPLVRHDLEEIIASVDDRSTTLMFTNGRALTPQRARSIKASGLFYLAVSLDSPDPAEHNRARRNPRAFAHAISAIENSVAAGMYTLVSAVVMKRNLTRQSLLQLLQLAQDHGAHEVRIHQPVPGGELASPSEQEKIFYTPADVEMLHSLQFEVNRKRPELPKMSSFTYTEGPEKFGCGAGVMHAYISATGDLWPCDFVPLSFGNVLQQPVKDLYREMSAAAGAPRTFCLARAVAPRLAGKTLPLTGDAARQMCIECRDRCYPRFFSDLQAA